MPFIGPVFLVGSVVFVDGPLQAGLFYVFIKAVRQLPTSASEVFAGFRFRYWQLVLGYIVPVILFALYFTPAVVLFVFFAVGGSWSRTQHRPLRNCVRGSFGVHNFCDIHCD